MKRLCLAFVFCCLLQVNIYGKYDITEFSLSNGLHLICLKKDTSPIISFSIWYNCGSICDAVSKSGVAHYLEHMAFCNNKGVFDDFLQDIGAARNAFTSFKMICFYEIVPAEHIENVFKHEALRLNCMDIDQQKFLAEKGAIMEERSMRCDTNPLGQYDEIVGANLFNRMDGGISIIGWKHEIEAIKPQDLIDFHNKWFAPNNATIVVIGNINIEEIKSLAEKYFSNIKAKDIPQKTIVTEKPLPVKEINFSSPKNGACANTEYVYFVPFAAKSDFRKCISLKLAMQILNQPDFFPRKTLEESLHKANSLSFQYMNGYFQYDIVVVSINCSSINNCVDSEKIWKYLKHKLINMNITKTALDAVKRQEAIGIAYKKDDIKQISEHFGFMLSTGFNVEQIQSLDDTIQSITLEECQKVLKEIFEQEPIAISRMTPKGYDRE